jgi:hypothetical protein
MGDRHALVYLENDPAGPYHLADRSDLVDRAQGLV